MTPTVLGIQSIVTIVNQFFGSELGREVLRLLKSRVPNLSEDQKATLDQHFTDYLGWKFDA